MPVKRKQPPYYSLAVPGKAAKLILPNKIRFAHRDVRLQPFHSLLCEITTNARKLCKNSKNFKFKNILTLFDNIIPLRYFGTKKNRKLFYRIIKLILTRSANECVYLKQLIKGFYVKEIPWLAPIVKSNGVNAILLCKRYFFEAQVWMLEKIVKPIISQFYVPVRAGQTHEIELVRKPMWFSFKKKVIRGLESKGHLISESSVVQPRGILQIRPKNGYNDPTEFRPILILKPEPGINTWELKQKFEQQNKTIISTIYKAAHKLSLTETSNMYGVWKNYVAATNGQIVYGVKIDVKDAFGNINVDVLCEILEEQCEQNEIPSKIAKFIMNRIQHQFIAEGQNKKGLPTRVWKWKHGLLQGDRFSSALCELYMSYLDSLHLDKFHKPTNILHRTVDDYFFCSTNEEDVKEFINVMNSVHTLNIKKTESNLPNYGNNEIGYCGQIFNMNTKQVKSLYYFKKHSEIRHRFKFWNIRRPINNKSHPEKNIETFLWRPMTIAYNRYRFKNMELNTAFNSETRFMNNYFEAMIFLAFKFDASVMAVSTIIKDFSLVTIVVKKTAHKYSHMAIKRLKQNKGPYYTGLLTMQVFLKIGLQAFILVLKKRTLYQRQKIIEHLVKYTRRISINHNMKINFKRFKFLPKIFNNISISRRLTC